MNQCRASITDILDIVHRVVQSRDYDLFNIICESLTSINTPRRGVQITDQTRVFREKVMVTGWSTNGLAVYISADVDDIDDVDNVLIADYDGVNFNNARPATELDIIHVCMTEPEFLDILLKELDRLQFVNSGEEPMYIQLVFNGGETIEYVPVSSWKYMKKEFVGIFAIKIPFPVSINAIAFVRSSLRHDHSMRQIRFQVMGDILNVLKVLDYLGIELDYW